jgi:hypothetical protein
MKKRFATFSVLTFLLINHSHAQNICTEPSSVPQSIWRSGLQDPIGDRVGLSTTHVVIHHSSDPNLQLDDYTPLVRNIYTYHTQSNGWDDIGYNYLIDPNGVIYKGRDPKSSIPQDEVQGAHMCNRNENTMGICMIGSFINVLPTRSALKALYTLTGWKINKDNINPFGFTTHAIGPISANLPAIPLAHICGHKDGCQSGYTECPGDLFHSTFDELRDSVYVYSSKCNITSLEKEELEQFKLISLGNQVYMIPAYTYKEIKIYNFQGKLLHNQNFADDVSIHDLPKDELLLVVLDGGQKDSFRFKFMRQ